MVAIPTTSDDAPPTRRSRPGQLMQNLSGAVGRALKEAGRRTLAEVESLWVAEVVLALALALVILLGITDSAAPESIPKVLAAFLVPLSALLAAIVIGFVVALIATPFIDHQKLVAQRDAYEYAIRAVNIRTQADDWVNWTRNELARLEKAKRHNHPVNADKHFDDLRDFLARKKADMESWGQPILAAELTPPKENERPTEVDGCLALVTPLHTLFYGWARGATIPPFTTEPSEYEIRDPRPYRV